MCKFDYLGPYLSQVTHLRAARKFKRKVPSGGFRYKCNFRLQNEKMSDVSFLLLRNVL